MLRRFLKRLFGSWSLERKFLVFFGVALLSSLVPAFWVLQNVAERLVMERTRQTARDFASHITISKHLNQFLRKGMLSKDRIPLNPSETRILDLLEPEFFRDEYFPVTLKLKDDPDLADVSADPPTSAFENDLLQKMALEINSKWKGIDEENPKTVDGANNGRESGTFSMEAPNQSPIFAEAVANGDKYYYYYPIPFKKVCLECHTPDPSKVVQEGGIRFRVLRIEMPHNSTRLWTMWTYSIMIAVAIATLGITLFLFHWILKRLVIRPLGHLHEVSDEISRGQTDRRANIDTDDEFNELGEAFNRMLRHLTETESEVRKVNTELDRRVDQLAQVNLQLYEANRLKSEFLANMSHELRTPLNSILGFSEVLQGFDSLTDKQKRYAGNIQRSGRLLLDMINDILDLAKVEAGKMQVRPTQFDVVHLVAGQCDVVRSLSEEKNIDLQVDSQIESILAFTDQAKFQQILTNLLSNAIKFTPEGGLITIQSGMADDERFFVSVADTGVGIAESDFEVIFEKFRQSRITKGGDELAREYSGTGLGLSIVRELCKLLGGEVMLSSTLGQGSVFQVELPIQYVAEVPSPSNLASEVNAIASSMQSMEKGTS